MLVHAESRRWDAQSWHSIPQAALPWTAHHTAPCLLPSTSTPMEMHIQLLTRSSGPLLTPKGHNGNEIIEAGSQNQAKQGGPA